MNRKKGRGGGGGGGREGEGRGGGRGGGEEREKTNTALFFTFWKKALLWLMYMYIQHACAQLTTQIHRANNMCLHDKFTNSNVTLYRKRALVAQIKQIELLVPLECAF